MRKTLTWLVFIISAILFTNYFYTHDKVDLLLSILGACLVSGPLALIVPIIYHIKWRYDNGIDMSATLENHPDPVKRHMLFIMQHHHSGGIKGALDELNDIFRNYPQWHLQDWKVFRAWYKSKIDFMYERPDTCRMTMKEDGSPYQKEKDPLYDPNAPDWEQYSREANYWYGKDEDLDQKDKVYDEYHPEDDDYEDDYDDDDYDDEYDDDDYDDDEDEDYDDDDDDETNYRSRRKRRLRKAAEEGFYTGIGLGAGLSLGDHPDL